MPQVNDSDWTPVATVFEAGTAKYETQRARVDGGWVYRTRSSYDDQVLAKQSWSYFCATSPTEPRIRSSLRTGARRVLSAIISALDGG